MGMKSLFSPPGLFRVSSIFHHAPRFNLPGLCGFYLFISISIFLSTSSNCLAANISGHPGNYLSLLSTLKSGDTLVLVPGTYRHGLPVHNMNASANKPIVIQGPNEQGEALFLAQPGHNTVSIVDSSHIVIRNLEIDGRGLYVDGVKAEGHSDYAHHITLEHIMIRNQGQHQQVVGISTKCPTWGWVIRNNVIVGAGTGMYLGDSDGSAPFINGLIEHNKVINTIGYNLQIKHQTVRPYDVDGLPIADGETVIRFNVFSKAENASNQGLARPNVLVGHWPLSGDGVNDVYKIYDNVFLQNPYEALFQGEGNIELYNNLFFNSYENGYSAIAIQKHNCVPRKIRVFNNTVISPGVGIQINGGSPRHLQVAKKNTVFADRPVIGGIKRDNVTGSFTEAGHFMHTPHTLLENLKRYHQQ